MGAKRSVTAAGMPEAGAQAAHAAERILDAAPIAMLLVDLQGQVLYANRAFATLAGDAPPRLASLLELIDQAEETAIRLELDRLVRGETIAWRAEHRIRHVGLGSVRVMIDAKLLDDVIILQLTDIELQKNAEEALVYSEARWNSALESARIHPDDRDRIRATARNQGQGVEGYDTLEYREQRRDGTYVWILSRGKPIEWDENGNVVRAVGTDTDITHLKAMEMELAAEKERLRVTLEAMADGMISTDLEGRVVFMNPAAEQLVGLAARLAVGRLANEVFRLRSEATGDLPSPVSQCLDRGELIRTEDDSCLVGHDGRLRDIRCTASPVTDGDKLSGVVLVFQDVTQSRALQRQLAHSANHDELTGLPNRAAFERALNGAIASARDGRREHCLLYVDLDRFKPVNDTAGHAAGDELLRQVGRTIRDSCRAHDVAARIGGDEFALILEDCSAANGMLVGAKIVRAIGALLFSWAGREYRIGASIGLTIITADPASPLGFMGEADAACYAAKGQGRAQVVAFRDMVNPLSRSKG